MLLVSSNASDNARFSPFLQATKALRESRGIARLCFRPQHSKGVRGQRHALAAFYPGKEPVPIVQEDVWVPGSVCTCAENLAPTGIRSPDRPARSQSLYRMS
jgi:hypothetical protein